MPETIVDVSAELTQRCFQSLNFPFEDAIGELKVLNRRMFRRKSQKASRGEFVGEPIPPGFYLPIVDRKRNGENVYGKMARYGPHSEIDELIPGWPVG